MDPGTQTLPGVQGGLHDPGRADRARRQPRRDSRQPRPRHARLPAPAGRGRRRGPEGQRAQPSRNAFRRFEPLNRDVAKLTGSLRKRRRNLARLIHNLQLLVTEVGTKDKELAELVVSQNAVFEAFANQDANLREFLRGCRPRSRPPTRRWPSPTQLTDAARPDAAPSCAPARARSRRRSARQRPFARQTIPPIKNQIRPFARAAQPTVKALKPAMQDFAKVTPKLATTLRRAQRRCSTRSPTTRRARAEGYLFWALLAEPHRRVRLHDPGRARPDPARHHLHRLHRARRARGDARSWTPSSAR